MLHALRYVFAALAAVLSFALTVLEFIALVDPVGTKMGDDGDPFGAPPSWSSHAGSLAMVVTLLVIAALLVRGQKAAAV